MHDEKEHSLISIDIQGGNEMPTIPAGETYYIVARVECSNNYDAIKSIGILINNEPVESFAADNIRYNRACFKELIYEWDVPTNTETSDIIIRAESINGAYNEIAQTVYISTGLNLVYDIDGNSYNIVTLGEQKWMAKNLKTTRYTDGTKIPIISNAEWQAIGDTGKAWCYYDYVSDYFEIYGALYNWNTAMNGATSSSADSGYVQGICPKGWHIPTYFEWLSLQSYLIQNGYNYDETSQENKIAKSMASTQWWGNSNVEGAIGNYQSANNRSGFSALPGGVRATDGTFYYLGTRGNWWTTTEMGEDQIYLRTLVNDHNDFVLTYGSKSMGASVRCLRD